MRCKGAVRPALRELRTEIAIRAPAQRVWSVLTDFARYPEWNPFIRQISGDLREGSRLMVRIGVPGSRPMTFRPRVIAAEPPRELRWLGHLFVPRLFDGEHSFVIEALDGEHVRFVQSERFGGVLVPLLGSLLTSTRTGFEAMNAALKQRVESE
jgi:hypothetical protein